MLSFKIAFVLKLENFYYKTCKYSENIAALTGIALISFLKDKDTPHPRYLSSSFFLLTNSFWTHFNFSGPFEQIEQGIFFPPLWKNLIRNGKVNDINSYNLTFEDILWYLFFNFSKFHSSLKNNLQSKVLNFFKFITGYMF